MGTGEPKLTKRMRGSTSIWVWEPIKQFYNYLKNMNLVFDNVQTDKQNLSEQ